VYVDGRPRGDVGLNQERALPLSPGVHTLRVRQWWFMSSPRTIEVGPQTEIRLQADAGSEGTLPRHLARAVFRPLHSLSLTSDGE
jgi:hypothetical protein